MTAVLLIADSERVQRIFADLESKGVLQLYAAATLDQVDQELTAALPAFTFVQSRISGLSTGILLRHLKKTLPETTGMILLSGDAGDLQPVPPLAIPLVDLRTADDVLAETVTGIVTGTGRTPAAGAKGESGAKKPPRQEKSGTRKGAKVEQADAQVPQGRAKKGESGTPHPQVKAKKAQGVKEAQPGRKPYAAAPPEQGEPQGSGAAGEPPAEIDVRPAEEEFSDLSQPTAGLHVPDAQFFSAGEASTAAPLPEPSPAGEPAVAEPPAPPSFLEMMAAASARIDSGVSLPPEVQDQVRVGASCDRAHLTVPAGELARLTEPQEPGSAPGADVPISGANPGQEARSRSGNMRKPRWLLLLLFAFFLIPSTAYLLGRVMTAQEQEARLQGDGVIGQRPALRAADTPATALRAFRGGAETAPKGAPPQEAAQVSGLAALPQFLEGVEVDHGYGDRHPNWERYLGAKAEYRLFREEGRYRAMQAIARADEIPDQLFRRVLLEFGGIAGYAVSSTGEQGDYLVEQATGSGSASLTIYRKRNDRRIKGLVVYYR